MQERATAGNQAFSPDDGTIEDAYWILLEEGAPLRLYEVHLADDAWSPSGYCWDCYAYTLEADGQWTDADGGQWWDYSDADQLLPEFPGDFDRAVALTEEEFDATLESAVAARLLCKVTIG